MKDKQGFFFFLYGFMSIHKNITQVRRLFVTYFIRVELLFDMSKQIIKKFLMVYVLFWSLKGKERLIWLILHITISGIDVV